MKFDGGFLFLMSLVLILKLRKVAAKSETKVGHLPCSDTNPKVCKARKDKGYCTNPKVQAAMQRICPKTCGHCGGSDLCKDGGYKCKSLVAKGACLDHSKEDEMKHKCQKSCNFCNDPDECKDSGIDCDRTAATGACFSRINFGWWSGTCRYSCNFCNCEDYDEDVCKEKANQGDCSDPKTRDAMSRMCRTSCGECGNVGSLCEDINPKICIERASKGACTDPETKDHMKHICKKTCDMCGSSEPNYCEDLDPAHCHKRAGDCSNDEMARMCPKTCRKCDLTCSGPGEEDVNPKVCSLRAAMGYCHDPAIGEFMKEICPKSCFVCPEIVIN